MSGSSHEIAELFARLEQLTKGERVASDVAKLKSLVYTLKRLPLEKQMAELKNVSRVAVNAISYFSDYRIQPEWYDKLLGPFVMQWGTIPIAELPINKSYHGGVVCWVRAELDRLRLEQARAQVVTLKVGGIEVPGVCLADTVDSLAARVAALAGCPAVYLYLYLDESFTMKGGDPLIVAGINSAEALLTWKSK
jgi:hypothetical protein